MPRQRRIPQAPSLPATAPATTGALTTSIAQTATTLAAITVPFPDQVADQQPEQGDRRRRRHHGSRDDAIDDATDDATDGTEEVNAVEAPHSPHDPSRPAEVVVPSRSPARARRGRRHPSSLHTDGALVAHTEYAPPDLTGASPNPTNMFIPRDAGLDAGLDAGMASPVGAPTPRRPLQALLAGWTRTMRWAHWTAWTPWSKQEKKDQPRTARPSDPLAARAASPASPETSRTSDLIAGQQAYEPLRSSEGSEGTATPLPLPVDRAALRRAAQRERATRLRAWRTWQREERRSGRVGSLQQRLLPVKEVLVDGTVVTRGPGDQGPDTFPALADQYVAVLEVGSVNFHLLSPDEQEALIDQYQRILAAQPTPVQIKIRLQPIDLSSYLEHIRASAARPFLLESMEMSATLATLAAQAPADSHAPRRVDARAAHDERNVRDDGADRERADLDRRADGRADARADARAQRHGRAPSSSLLAAISAISAPRDTRDTRNARDPFAGAGNRHVPASQPLDSAAPWRLRLAEDHLRHLTTLATQRNLLERRFYLIVSATRLATGDHRALAPSRSPLSPISRLSRALAASAAWFPLPFHRSQRSQQSQRHAAPLSPSHETHETHEAGNARIGASSATDNELTDELTDELTHTRDNEADDLEDDLDIAHGDPFGESGLDALDSPWARSVRGQGGPSDDRAWVRRHAAQQHLDQRCRDLIRSLSTLRLSTRRVEGDDLVQLLASCVTPVAAQRHPLTASRARALIPWPTVVSPLQAEQQTIEPTQPVSLVSPAPVGTLQSARDANARRLRDGRATPSPIGRSSQVGWSDWGTQVAQIGGDDGGDETGMWRRLSDTLAPASAEVHPDWVRVGEELSATVAVTGYPRFVAPGWFGDLVDLDQPGMEIDLHLRPRANPAMIRQLRRRLTELDASRRMDQRAGRLEDPERRLAVADLTAMIDRLQRSEERIFEVGLYLTARAPRRNLRLLRARVRQIESTLGTAFLTGGIATFEQAAAFRSLLPLGLDALHRFRLLDAATLASAFPFTSLSLTMPEGALYGVVPQNNSLVVLDPFSSQLENANMVIFAKSGAGKSYFCKLLALRMLLLGTAITIIDPEPLEEYRDLCHAAHGAYLRLAPTADARINPFDLPQGPPFISKAASASAITPTSAVGAATDAARLAAYALAEKIQSLLTFLALLVAEAPPGETPYLTNEEKGALDQALHRTYARAGITADPATHARTPPLLRDLYETLRGARDPIAPSAYPATSGSAFSAVRAESSGARGSEQRPPTAPQPADEDADAPAQRPARPPQHAQRLRGAPRILPFPADGDPLADTADTAAVEADADGATPLDRRLADRLARYVHGSLAGLFAGQTTVQLDNPLVVFSLRDLDGDLRPVGLWLVSEFVWTRMRQEGGRQPRLLFIDEAWTLAQRPEGSQFLAGLARRARKYYLGLVTITQDVGDFLQNADGRTVLNQASIQLLLMQSSATIQQVVETFRLTQGERNYLLACPKGHGLLFARNTHVALRIEASPFEHQLATTNPRERASLDVLQEQGQEQGQEQRQDMEALGSASASSTETEKTVETDTYADHQNHQGGAG